MSTIHQFFERFALAGLGVCAFFLLCVWMRYYLERARKFVRRYGALGVLVALMSVFAAVTEGPPTNEYKDAVQGALDGEAQTNSAFGALLVGGPACGRAGGVNLLVAPPPASSASHRLVSVTTNEDFSYAMPSNAVCHAPWTLRGAAEDWTRVELGSANVELGQAEWRFPFGTDDLSAVQVFTDGTIRPKLHSLSNQLVAVGSPLSAIPGVSRFWYAVGTNDSRILTWDNFAIGRIPLPPQTFQAPQAFLSAQIELWKSGDYIVRSNGVERFYRFVDPFDWPDGEWGQSDVDRASIDAAVGTGLENGCYKLTVTVPPTVCRRTLIKVGDQQIAVDQPGEYAFLLAKGVRYGLDLMPYSPHVRYEAVDDITPSAGLLGRGQRLGRGMRAGRWTADGGEVELIVPNPLVLFVSAAHVIWTPCLSVSPGNWEPSENFPGETFTAVLTDVPFFASPTNRWTTTDPTVVSIDSPTEMTTAMECHYPRADEKSCGLALDVGFLDCALHVDFVREEPGSDEDRMKPKFTIPNTFFTNDDDDDDDGRDDGGHPFVSPLTDDDLIEVKVWTPEAAGMFGIMRVDGVRGYDGGFTGEDEMVFLDVEGLRPLGEGASLDALHGLPISLCFNPRSRSSSYLGTSIKATYEPDDGQSWSSTARFTVVEPVAEPICTDTTNVFEYGRMRRLTVNPCGVAVGRDAYFRIAVEPSDYPDSQIVWSVDEGCAGSVSFIGGNTGRAVTVRGVSTGDVTLKVQIGDCRSHPPTFTLRVVEPKEVRLSAWIVANQFGQIPFTPPKVLDMVNEAEDIFSQVGVTFDIGDRISVTNIAEAFDVFWENGTDDTWDFDRLVATHSNTGGLECYFVNSIKTGDSDFWTIGGHGGSGIVISARGGTLTLAHEIGHSFGMHDVYCKVRNGLIFQGLAKRSWNMNDWNGGCDGHGHAGARYYASGTFQRQLIQRMLMNGRKTDEDVGRDITYGAIHGFNSGDSNAVDDVDTGFFDNIDHVSHPCHQ